MLYTMRAHMAKAYPCITLDTETGTITGNTYDMRAMIKEDFPGAQWDKAAKCWRYADIEGRINEFRDYFRRCYFLAELTPAEAEPVEVEPPVTGKAAAPSKPATAHDAVVARITGLCPRCGTYCYGDCSFR